jgi:tRNA(Arg) A34 adenosine deaminase TadA
MHKRSKQQNYMCKAASVAAKSDVAVQKHGAVVVDRSTGRVVATGNNHYSSHMVQQFTCHAEIAALLSVRRLPPRIVKRLDLYVVRVGQEGSLVQSKPCRACINVIQQFGIRRVYYSASHSPGTPYNCAKYPA